MLQDSAQTRPPGSPLSGRLGAGTMTAQTERAFTEYWHNDEGIKKKKKPKASALSCLDTPQCDMMVRKTGFLGTLEGTRQKQKGTSSHGTVHRPDGTEPEGEAETLSFRTSHLSEDGKFL